MSQQESKNFIRPGFALKCIAVSVLIIKNLLGCSSWGERRIDDIRFTSVAMVNLLDYPEIEWPGERPSLQLLRIDLESQFNIEILSNENEFNVSNLIFYCSDGPDKYDGGVGRFPGVYSSRGVISPYADMKSVKQTNHPGLFRYHVYISLVGVARENVMGQEIPSYDLRRPSGDLCVRIHGGNMMGGYMNTNIIVIPSGAISKATKQ